MCVCAYSHTYILPTIRVFSLRRPLPPSDDSPSFPFIRSLNSTQLSSPPLRFWDSSVFAMLCLFS
jgi:hypothetical protein